MASPPRDRRPTLADVAALTGVSTALVSIVMREAPGASPATRERVCRAADELGYRPDARARLLRSTRSRLLGVVFDVRQDFHGDLLGGLYAAGELLQYELTLSAVTPVRDEERAMASLLQDRCEAIILLGPRSPTARLAELATRLPVVVVARPVRAAGVHVVRTTDDAGQRQAVDHLVSLGHRRITHIDGGRAPGAAQRRRGFSAAMTHHGLSEDQHIIRGGPGEDDAAHAAGELLKGPLPSAVTVFNDRCAVAVMDVLHRSRLSVPEEISVIGYDDSRVAALSSIQLTTVAQDADEMASLAVGRVADRLDGAVVGHRELIVPPRLVIRSTTASPV